MAEIRAWLDQAAATHRQAAAVAGAAGAMLDGHSPTRRGATDERSIREIAERLRVAAALLTPGWLGAALDAVPASTPLGITTQPELVRIGTAYPLDDASFPVLAPLGHLAFDGDARDPRVAGTLRAVLLRLLATAAPGSLLVRAVDPAGDRFAAFEPLHDAGIMPPPVTDRPGLVALLDEAEQWVRAARSRPDRTLLLAIAAWPETTEPADQARLAALAQAGPAARLHLLVGGWPPPPLLSDTVPGPLAQATQVTLHNPHVLIGHPPGGCYASPVPPGQPASPGLPAPAYLDEAPANTLINRVCMELASLAVNHSRLTLGELLPADGLWAGDATTGLEVVVGRAGDAPVRLRLAEITPHWLIIGRPGAGKTALLLSVLYGLCSRYCPEQLRLYLLDFTGRGSFSDFVPRATDPSYLPHARAVGISPDHADGVGVLRGLADELTRRQATAPAGGALPRVVCLIDDLAPLLADEEFGPEAGQLLGTLAQQGGAHGIHLVLASHTLPSAAITSQCRVRIALPGGGAALDPANQAAAALAQGTAVVNTASGLGGPRGATRAHEQHVRFPDPYADGVALAGLRHRLWRAGGGPVSGEQS
ncbi:hypothetical protein JQS43_24125 [Natronosporangium hydrolyticum]|uniref:FtsK domain-containing protein n=1 Tax=Natronosporangium hydrolyticum TaxID=2811111 RepID=A0A895YGB2_9ACTN|nr:FtsK/SpoIIIE domain-containing protein [Natronosporangium hydrolyticum]QSB14529.1 hypothetical protein JQS43_24125 [Natronosporangium hydrolyticum]